MILFQNCIMDSITTVLIGAARAITSATVRGYCIMVVALGILSFAADSQARDYGQYKAISSDIKAWIEKLTDNLGVPCCAIADGAVPDVWEMNASHYRVKIYGAWLDVPDYAVVKGPNFLGHSIVWVDSSEETMTVRCFIPGPQA